MALFPTLIVIKHYIFIIVVLHPGPGMATSLYIIQHPQAVGHCWAKAFLCAFHAHWNLIDSYFVHCWLSYWNYTNKNRLVNNTYLIVILYIQGGTGGSGGGYSTGAVAGNSGGGGGGGGGGYSSGGNNAGGNQRRF